MADQKATETEKAYFFRPYTKDDIPFIQNSWGNSYYKGALYCDFMSPKEFHFHHRPIRERFFEKPTAAVIVCVATNDTNLIIGWAAVEKPLKTNAMILHYVYVKEAFKKEGISTELLSMSLGKVDLVFLTHVTERAAKIMNRRSHKFTNFWFTPHLI